MLTGQTISLIFALIFLVLTLWGLIMGYMRGVTRQSIRLATIVFSILVSFAVTTILSKFTSTLCADKTVEELLMALGLNGYLPPDILNILSCYDAMTIERTLELPLLTIIIPFIYSICFIISSGLTYIVHGVFCFILNFSKKPLKFPNKCGGMFIGLVQGVIVALIFLLPYMNIIGIAGDVNDRIVEKHDEDTSNNQFCRLYNEYLEPTRNSALFSVAYDSFCDTLCDSFATVDISGEDTNLKDTLAFLVAMVSDLFEFGAFDWTNPTDEQCDSIEQMANDLAHNRYVSYILSGTLRGTATAVDNNLLSLENIEEPVYSVVKSLIFPFTTLNEDNFAQDVDTVSGVYLILVREDVILTLYGNSPDAVTKIFVQTDDEGKTVVDRIIEKIEENERMNSIVKMLTNLTLSIMLNNLGVENGAEIYASISTSIKDLTNLIREDYETDEEYHDAVSEQLNETLSEQGINLDEQILDDMATHFVDNYSDTEELTNEAINSIILSYYEAYINSSSATKPEGIEP